MKITSGSLCVKSLINNFPWQHNYKQAKDGYVTCQASTSVVFKHPATLRICGGNVSSGVMSHTSKSLIEESELGGARKTPLIGMHSAKNKDLWRNIII